MLLVFKKKKSHDVFQLHTLSQRVETTVGFLEPSETT